MTSTIDKLLNYKDQLNQYAEEEFDQFLDETFMHIESESKLQQLLDELQSKKQEYTEAIEKEILELKIENINPDTAVSLLHFVIAGLLDTRLLEYFTVDDAKELHELLEGAIYHDNIEAVKWLLDKGASPSTKDEDGYTMIQLTLCNEASEEIVKLLIEKGADVNARGVHNLTNLDIAVGSGCSVLTIKMLIDHGAEITQYSINQLVHIPFHNQTIKSQALLLMLGSSQGIKIDLSSDLIYQFFTNNHNIKALFGVEGYEAQKAIAKENILTSFQEYGQAYNDQNALDMAQLVSSQEIEVLDITEGHEAKLAGDFDCETANAA